ncbi:4Fe-4S binding protein [Mycolicibacterium porcinum]|uniref:4Fe-4S binding protein n=1 Tax=Mycolicibacterium porcinum TaxID=39693 RepID=A0AAW5SVS6_9MYCO|nr:4Fe-4S binding protein [Mycolicibacterium porcinum]MCV7386452.1 4Fe-4S binding protein [Mycolicibacterium porcinum]ORB39049.1 ferredoxin [Mycolicibacterium porcinum]CDO30877.1 4Fe-4S ferredoxin [Mycolicibacterium vulneris]
MTYVITQNCCKDASCVSVCPVDCIRPDREVQGSGLQMLYIDPDTCVDCGACEVECPVDAIYYEDDLPQHLERYRDINADYFGRHPLDAKPSLNTRERARVEPGALRVAVVGSGPAACYTVAALLDIEGVEVDVFERLPTPFGLVRAGVAPDHQRTKSITEMFGTALGNPRLRCYFNVEIGADITHEELVAHHHAVIYGVGASKSRDLAVPGEDLAGSVAAAEFVAWYNGHPDNADAAFDLSGDRAVIVGNGNVALDIARVLLSGPDALQGTDIAQHALDALATSTIEEVVILGRRGPRHAAFSAAELLGLGHLPGIDVIMDGDDFEVAPDDDDETALKLQVAREYYERPTTPGNKRIVFRFMTSPVEIIGDGRVEAVRVVPNSFDQSGQLASGDESKYETIETGLVMRSIGYLGAPVAGVPFDAATGRIPNANGRVLDSQDNIVGGVYVTGWIKRGPRGVIGTNRACAHETAAGLWEDFSTGKLSRSTESRDSIDRLVAQRNIRRVDWTGWRAIDAAERERGASAGRPRLKIVQRDQMLNIIE